MSVWFIYANNKQEGPISFDEMLPRVATSPQALVWTEGMEGWLKASETDAFRDIVRAAQPQFPAPAAPTFGSPRKSGGKAKDPAAIVYDDLLGELQVEEFENYNPKMAEEMSKRIMASDPASFSADMEAGKYSGKTFNLDDIQSQVSAEKSGGGKFKLLKEPPKDSLPAKDPITRDPLTQKFMAQTQAGDIAPANTTSEPFQNPVGVDPLTQRFMDDAWKDGGADEPVNVGVGDASIGIGRVEDSPFEQATLDLEAEVRARLKQREGASDNTRAASSPSPVTPRAVSGAGGQGPLTVTLDAGHVLAAFPAQLLYKDAGLMAAARENLMFLNNAGTRALAAALITNARQTITALPLTAGRVTAVRSAVFVTSHGYGLDIYKNAYDLVVTRAGKDGHGTTLLALPETYHEVALNTGDTLDVVADQVLAFDCAADFEATVSPDLNLTLLRLPGAGRVFLRQSSADEEKA